MTSVFPPNDTELIFRTYSTTGAVTLTNVAARLTKNGVIKSINIIIPNQTLLNNIIQFPTGSIPPQFYPINGATTTVLPVRVINNGTAQMGNLNISTVDGSMTLTGDLAGNSFAAGTGGTGTAGIYATYI